MIFSGAMNGLVCTGGGFAQQTHPHGRLSVNTGLGLLHLKPGRLFGTLFYYKRNHAMAVVM